MKQRTGKKAKLIQRRKGEKMRSYYRSLYFDYIVSFFSIPELSPIYLVMLTNFLFFCWPVFSLALNLSYFSDFQSQISDENPATYLAIKEANQNFIFDFGEKDFLIDSIQLFFNPSSLNKQLGKIARVELLYFQAANKVKRTLPLNYSPESPFAAELRFKTPILARLLSIRPIAWYPAEHLNPRWNFVPGDKQNKSDYELSELKIYGFPKSSRSFVKGIKSVTDLAYRRIKGWDKQGKATYPVCFSCHTINNALELQFLARERFGRLSSVKRKLDFKIQDTNEIFNFLEKISIAEDGMIWHPALPEAKKTGRIILKQGEKKVRIFPIVHNIDPVEFYAFENGASQRLTSPFESRLYFYRNGKSKKINLCVVNNVDSSDPEKSYQGKYGFRQQTGPGQIEMAFNWGKNCIPALIFADDPSEVQHTSFSFANWRLSNKTDGAIFSFDGDKPFNFSIELKKVIYQDIPYPGLIKLRFLSSLQDTGPFLGKNSIHSYILDKTQPFEIFYEYTQGESGNSQVDVRWEKKAAILPHLKKKRKENALDFVTTFFFLRACAQWYNWKKNSRNRIKYLQNKLWLTLNTFLQKTHYLEERTIFTALQLPRYLFLIQLFEFLSPGFTPAGFFPEKFQSHLTAWRIKILDELDKALKPGEKFYPLYLKILFTENNKTYAQILEKAMPYLKKYQIIAEGENLKDSLQILEDCYWLQLFYHLGYRKKTFAWNKISKYLLQYCIRNPLTENFNNSLVYKEVFKTLLLFEEPLELEWIADKDSHSLKVSMAEIFARQVKNFSWEISSGPNSENWIKLLDLHSSALKNESKKNNDEFPFFLNHSSQPKMEFKFNPLSLQLRPKNQNLPFALEKKIQEFNCPLPAKEKMEKLLAAKKLEKGEKERPVFIRFQFSLKNGESFISTYRYSGN
ncbi:hypothetical protein ACFL35_10920 [Candidatus Riflebacteria bacterium]